MWFPSSNDTWSLKKCLTVTVRLSLFTCASLLLGKFVDTETNPDPSGLIFLIAVCTFVYGKADELLHSIHLYEPLWTVIIRHVIFVSAVVVLGLLFLSDLAALLYYALHGFHKTEDWYYSTADAYANGKTTIDRDALENSFLASGIVMFYFAWSYFPFRKMLHWFVGKDMT